MIPNIRTRNLKCDLAGIQLETKSKCATSNTLSGHIQILNNYGIKLKKIYLQHVASVSKELLFCFIHVCQNVVSQGLNCDMKKMKYNIV